jgi:hypothetical protein
MCGSVACLTLLSSDCSARGRFTTISACFLLIEEASTLAVQSSVLWVPRPKPVIDCISAFKVRGGGLSIADFQAQAAAATPWIIIWRVVLPR